jgi:hypothetical protein
MAPGEDPSAKHGLTDAKPMNQQEEEAVHPWRESDAARETWAANVPLCLSVCAAAVVLLPLPIAIGQIILNDFPVANASMADAVAMIGANAVCSLNAAALDFHSDSMNPRGRRMQQSCCVHW